MTGIVLAGGASRRMGIDKAFLKLNGLPLVELILRSMKNVFKDIIIVTNTPHLYGSYGTRVVTDAFEQSGPLTGIYSGLSHARDEFGFVVACDMPYLNQELIAYMAGLASDHDVVVPWLADSFEPLHAVYRKSLLPLMREQIGRDRRSVQDMFGQVVVRRVEAHEVDLFDPAHKSFKNLNTPQEYEEAACAG